MNPSELNVSGLEPGDQTFIQDQQYCDEIARSVDKSTRKLIQIPDETIASIGDEYNQKLRIELKETFPNVFLNTISNGFPLLSSEYQDFCNYTVTQTDITPFGSGSGCDKIAAEFPQIVSAITNHNLLNSLFSDYESLMKPLDIPRILKITLENQNDEIISRSTSVNVGPKFCTVTSETGQSIQPCSCPEQTEVETEICVQAINLGEKLYKNTTFDDTTQLHILDFTPIGESGTGKLKNEYIYASGQPRRSVESIRELLPEEEAFNKKESITNAVIQSGGFSLGITVPNELKTILPEFQQLDTFVQQQPKRKFIYAGCDSNGCICNLKGLPPLQFPERSVRSRSIGGEGETKQSEGGSA